MKPYKHYSFDLWDTLIYSNPAFKEARTEYFYDNFNPNKKTHLEITVAFRKISELHNTVAETCGSGLTPAQMYAAVLHLLENDMSSFTPITISRIKLATEKIFADHRPHIFDDVVDTLSMLKQRGATMSILSNTGYMDGTTLKNFLSKSPLANFFSFMLFSSDIEVSKPHFAAFENIHVATAKIGLFDLCKKDILHTGDSPYADIVGATRSGMTGFLARQQGKTLKELLQ